MSGGSLPGTVDVLIAGSGAGALVGAITARLAGLSVAVIEKADEWGGTSAMSGGAVWIPCNAVMREAGLEDSPEQAATYLANVIGEDAGPNGTLAHRMAYIANAAPMVEMLDGLGFRWARDVVMADYYADLPGSAVGRSLNPKTVDASPLGPMLKTLRRSIAFPALTYDYPDFGALRMPFHTFANFVRSGRILGLTALWRLRGREPAAMGRSLMAQLMGIAQRIGLRIYLGTELLGLETAGGRIAAVRVKSGGVESKVTVERAVLLATGGFSHDRELRKQHHGLDGIFSATQSGDLGQGIAIAQDCGAATGLMDAVWWNPTVRLPDGKYSIMLWECSVPHGIVVDGEGRRYMNEAAPYPDRGPIMVAQNRQTPAIPSWLIFDRQHRRRYTFQRNPSWLRAPSYVGSNFFTKARTLRELACKCGIDPAVLEETVKRFNQFAKQGRDEDFGRGEKAYDRKGGDAEYAPNPNLGALEQAPFYAVQIYPGDIGTKGGLAIDPSGGVEDVNGQPIPGLYACGNVTASVMGKGYPGGGATLGPAMTFAYIAMRDIVSTQAASRN